MAVTSPKQARRGPRRPGLIAVEVEPTDAAIAERITLALIEAVANDHLSAGDRVVVVYSGFEAETLDSMTVVRLGEHLERLTSRDLRALETSVPFETLKAVVDVAVEIGREGREGKSGRHADRRRRRPQRPGPQPDAGLRPVQGLSPQGAQHPRPAGPRGDQGDRPARRRLRRRPRRHGRGRLPNSSTPPTPA